MRDEDPVMTAEEKRYAKTCGLPFEQGKTYKVTYLATYIDDELHPSSLFSGDVLVAHTSDDYWLMTHYVNVEEVEQ